MPLLKDKFYRKKCNEMIQELELETIKTKLGRVARKPYEVNQSFFGGLTIVCYAEDTQAVTEFFRANCIVQRIDSTAGAWYYSPPVPIGDAIVYFRHLFTLATDSRDSRDRSTLVYKACVRNGIYQAKTDSGQGQGQPDWGGPPAEFFL